MYSFKAWIALQHSISCRSWYMPYFPPGMLIVASNHFRHHQCRGSSQISTQSSLYLAALSSVTLAVALAIAIPHLAVSTLVYNNRLDMSHITEGSSGVLGYSLYFRSTPSFHGAKIYSA